MGYGWSLGWEIDGEKNYINQCIATKFMHVHASHIFDFLIALYKVGDVEHG